jgi:hypothetical protein
LAQEAQFIYPESLLRQIMLLIKGAIVIVLMQGKAEVAIEARQATEALITAHLPYG